jgi:predicted porin
MNKIVASVGVMALGASGLQAASVADLTSEGTKPWTLSASLRGFYDDNVNSEPSGANLGGASRDTFGFSFSPGVSFLFPMEETTISFGYVYTFLYYANKPLGEVDNYDQDHTFNLEVDHSFSERYQASVRDSFVIGQEPDMLRAGNAFTSFQRVPGNNIRNYGSVTFDAVLTPVLSLEVGYANGFYDYKDEDAVFIPGPLPTVNASLAGLLNRLDHNAHVDLRWRWMPETVLLVGYQYGETDYTANEVIGVNTSGIGQFFVKSDSRNDRSQYGYFGVDHTFRPDLTGSVRVGARYNDYYNDPTSASAPSPYAMATLRFAYMPESYLETGLSYDRSTTDLFSIDERTGSITTDAESFDFWVTLTHRIMPKLYGNLTAQIQHSTYNGGILDSESDMFYTLGLSLEYRFTPNFSANIGYDYDRLDSSSVINNFETTGSSNQGATGDNRSFDRNRVYVGVTATY